MHLPRVARQLIRHESISDVLPEFGYEPDDQTLSALDGVTPDYGESARRKAPPQRLPYTSCG